MPIGVAQEEHAAEPAEVLEVVDGQPLEHRRADRRALRRPTICNCCCTNPRVNATSVAKALAAASPSMPARCNASSTTSAPRYAASPGDVLLRRDLDQLGVGQEQVVQRTEDGRDLLLPAERPPGAGNAQLAEDAVGQRAQQVLLGAHMAVEGHGRHAAAVGQARMLSPAYPARPPARRRRRSRLHGSTHGRRPLLGPCTCTLHVLEQWRQTSRNERNAGVRTP